MAKPTPTAPTISLPPLAKLSSHSPSQIQSALANLRALYFPSASSSSVIGSGNETATSTETKSKPKYKTVLDTDSSHLTLPKPKRFIQHPIHDLSVPDSGYASAEEEGEDEQVLDSDTDEDDQGEDSCLSILRADPLERAYAIKWVTGLVARADIWLSSSRSYEDRDLSSSSPSFSAEEKDDSLEDAEDSNDDDEETRLSILDEATALLSAFSRPSEDAEEEGEEEDASLTRTFSFPLSFPSDLGNLSEEGRAESKDPTPHPQKKRTVEVQLNDAPLSTTDHTSVGLQSWGSSIVLAERMCASPGVFLPEITPTSSKAKANRKVNDKNEETEDGDEDKDKKEKEKEEEEGEEDTPLRILELGAGTGLLSIVAAKILGLDGTRPHEYGGQAEVEVVATDYHPDVLANLRRNVETNFPSSSSDPLLKKEPPIQVHALDWSSPPIPSSQPSASSSSTSSSSASTSSAPGPNPKKPFDKPFDLILAADVIYHPQHAEWIRGCVEGMLRKPRSRSGGRSESTPKSCPGCEPKPDESSCSSSSSSEEEEEDDLEQQQDNDHDKGGTFWLIIPLRTTGRHAGMDASVEGVFRDVSALSSLSSASASVKEDGERGGGDEDEADGESLDEEKVDGKSLDEAQVDGKSEGKVNGEKQGQGEMRLAVLHREEIPRKGGVGRADEGGYKLYKIGWVEV